MKNKLVLLAGVGVGYVLGARAGREQYDRLAEQARSLWGDPRVQEQVSHAQSTVKEQAPVVGEKVAAATKDAVDRVTPSGRRDSELNDSGAGTEGPRPHLGGSVASALDTEGVEGVGQPRPNGHRVLEVHLSGETVRAITGSMVAYDGQVTFKNAGMGGGGGLRAALKQRVTGESLSMMECTGHGVVYLAVDAQDITVVDMTGDTLQVESQQLLALDGALRTDVTFTGLRGASSGQGLFTTAVSGHGQLALLSAGGPPIALEVSPQHPLVVDPDAYVASRGQLNQTFVTDVSWKMVIGEDSGEAFSLRFDGSGVVYIQPAER